MAGGDGTMKPLTSTDPRQVGSWRLTGRLGIGGMGTVYLGQRAGTSAAVKVIAAGLADSPAFRSRFRREIEICRRVSGPQVAELLDADADAPSPWLAIRYVPGPTLDRAVDAHGAMSGDTLRGFALATAEALNQIHDAGVVHRDLKPTNVILTAETPVLIDFGIAAAADATSLTATGTSMGSAGWMAPEQILGTPTGPATDVFAWGALVAYVSTGTPPYETGRPESLTYRVVHGEPDLATVPAEYRDLVASALSTDPAERPTVPAILAALGGGASETIADTIIETWAGDEATKISTTQISELPLSQAPGGARRRAGLASIAAAALIAVAMIAGVLFPGGGDSQEADATKSAEGDASSASASPSSTPKAEPESEPATTTSTAPQPADIRSLHLQDAQLRYVCWGDTVAIKGNGERVPTDDGEYSAEVVEITYADLTGDGREDALVDTSCGFVGGNRPSSSVAVVSSELDGPRQIGEPVDGAAPSVHGQGLVVERPIYTDSDPMCCPSGTEYVPIVVDGDGWHESSARQLGAGDRATIGRLGALKIGDSYADLAASVAGPVEIHDDAETDGSCVWVGIPTLDADVSGLGGDGTLHSLEIDDSAIVTKSGLGIGSTEDDLRNAFPGELTTDDHVYQPGGHYLTFEANDGSGSVVFETDGSTVTRYRIGESGWTSAVEGCL